MWAQRVCAVVRKARSAVNGPLLASWTFDTVAKGELSRATRYADGLQYTTSIAAYDALGRSLATTINIPSDPAYGNLSGTYRFRSTYNSDGTIKTNTLPAAGGLPKEVVTYEYNELGLPTLISGFTGAETLDYVHDTTYAKQGQLLQRMQYRADGSHQAKYTWSTRTYDPATNRLRTARVHAEIGHGSLVEQNYSYDAAGNVLSIRDEPTAQGLLPDVQCFAYDDMRRLTSEWTSMASGDQACDSAPYRDTMGGAAPYWYSYAYDDLGNRVSETRHGLAEGSDVESTYQRPGAGEERPHAVTQVDSNGASGTATYTYDEAGNMTSRQNANRNQSLEWDAEGQLVAVHEGQNTSEFVYDAEGERLIRDDGGMVTLFLPGMEVSFDKEDLTSRATRFYEHAGEVVASRSNDGRVHWIFSDHHKTGQLALDSLTGEGIRRRFTAFGADRGSTGGAWPNSRGFVGGVIDDQAGLTRLGARSYDAGLGSFISPDPVVDFSDPEQMHGYAYSNSNPVSFTDPDGLFLRKAFAQARRWAAYRARQAVIRAYQIRLAVIRAYRIRMAAIRAARIRAAQIRAAKIRAARIRAAKIAAARKAAAAAKAAAARKAAAAKAARARAARVAAEKRRDAARRQAQRQQVRRREAVEATTSRSGGGSIEHRRVANGSGISDFREPTDNPSGPGPIDCSKVECTWEDQPVSGPPPEFSQCVATKMGQSAVVFGVSGFIGGGITTAITGPGAALGAGAGFVGGFYSGLVAGGLSGLMTCRS